MQHDLLEPWRTKGAGRNCVLGPVSAARPECGAAGGFSMGSDRVLGQVPGRTVEQVGNCCIALNRKQPRVGGLRSGRQQACSWAPRKEIPSNIPACRRPVECGSWAGRAVQAELLTPHAGQPKDTASFALSSPIHLPPYHRLTISTTDSQTHPTPAHQEDSQV